MAINFDHWIKILPSGCWVWTYKLNKWGYGNYAKRRTDGSKVSNAHVWAWERVNGRVPDGQELHHTCLNRACCNPNHMQALTHAEHKAIHAAMATAWGCGHAKVAGSKFCRECRNAYSREYQSKWRQSHPRVRKSQA